MKKNIRITSSILLCLYIAAVAYLCFARPDNLPQAPMYLFGLPMDKLAHFVMFVPFPILAYMTFVNLEMSIWRKIAVLTVIMAAGAGMAIGTERIQSVLAYRTGDVNDSLSDCIGLLAGGLVILCGILIRHCKKKQ